MLLRRWNSKRDPKKRLEISEFLMTPEGRGMSDRQVARRFLVHHQLVARLRPESTSVGVDDSNLKSTPPDPAVGVDDSPRRPFREDSAARSKRLADLETKFARQATEQWARSFDPAPEAPTKRLSAAAQAYADELAKSPPGEMPDLPAFLDCRRKP